MSSSSGWLTHVLGMADRCSGAWLTTMGLAAVAASWMHGGAVRHGRRQSDHVLSATRRAPARQGHRRRPGDRRDPRRPDARRHPRTSIPQAGERCQRCPTTDVKHASGDPPTMPQDITPEVCNLPPEMAAFSWPGISRRKGGSM